MTRPFVFIVEDDPRLREIIVLTLEADFELETCADGNTAMERLNHIAPQVVILDLNLPGMSGREILAYIRAQARLAKTQVILTTADNRQAETLNNDADIVLLKPVSPAQLRELTLRLSSMP
jgi:two-component system phosphate regulon response regulator PhoB